VEGEQLTLRAAVLTPDGKQRITAQTSGVARECESLGQQLAERLLSSGARALLDINKYPA
jgi:porphobilinogen deaminase